MLKEDIKYLDQNHTIYKQQKIVGRYITLKDIEPIINKLPKLFKVKVVGLSTNKQSIYKITVGNGKHKILFWSQMHGNESTGTKAMFDLFNFLANPFALEDLRNEILNNCTLVFIPLLNPDGAEEYTRLNSQKIDLNRDAIDLKAPESRLLKDMLNDFIPNYCFNLHDQRTLFSVTKANNPATLSFLAPSEDEQRTLTRGRMKTMEVIVGMNNDLQQLIPNQIGRYTDEFYPTATGDNFQKAGYNTILIEAGHFQDDYQREIARKYNFIALISGMYQIKALNKINYKDYFKIPDNEQNYLDVIYTNINIKGQKTSYGVSFKEKLVDKNVNFIPIIKKLKSTLNVNANRKICDEFNFSSVKAFEIFLSIDLLE